MLRQSRGAIQLRQNRLTAGLRQLFKSQGPDVINAEAAFSTEILDAQ